MKNWLHRCKMNYIGVKYYIDRVVKHRCNLNDFTENQGHYKNFFTLIIGASLAIIEPFIGNLFSYYSLRLTCSRLILHAQVNAKGHSYEMEPIKIFWLSLPTKISFTGPLIAYKTSALADTRTYKKVGKGHSQNFPNFLSIWRCCFRGFQFHPDWIHFAMVLAALSYARTGLLLLLVCSSKPGCTYWDGPTLNAIQHVCSP